MSSRLLRRQMYEYIRHPNPLTRCLHTYGRGSLGRGQVRGGIVYQEADLARKTLSSPAAGRQQARGPDGECSRLVGHRVSIVTIQASHSRDTAAGQLGSTWVYPWLPPDLTDGHQTAGGPGPAGQSLQSPGLNSITNTMIEPVCRPRKQRAFLW